MAEQDKSSKTEKATPQRLKKLRDEGKLLKSADVGTAAVLLLVGFTLALMMSQIGAHAARLARATFRLQLAHEPLSALGGFREALVMMGGPVLVAAFLAAWVGTMAQTRGYFSFKGLEIKAEKFQIANNLKKMLPGKESGVEILKQSLKLGGVGFAVFYTIKSALPLFLGLGASPLPAGIAAVLDTFVTLLKFGISAFIIVAAIDYALAKRKYDEDAKMSKRDVRDEFKQQEGDPLIKRRIRMKARELAAARASTVDVARATVMVTNPTHISIALKYVPEEDDAPMVIAKGIDQVALKLRQRARRAGVPIVENKPFARAMYKQCKVGQPLPPELFGPAAEVIAHVLRLRGELPAQGSNQAEARS